MEDELQNEKDYEMFTAERDHIVQELKVIKQTILDTVKKREIYEKRLLVIENQICTIKEKNKKH